MTCATSLLGLDQHACRVGAQVRLFEGVGAHRGDDRSGEFSERDVPAAHRRAGKRQAVATVHALQAIERQVIVPTLHDAVGEHAGAGDAACNRLRRRLGHVHARFAITVSIFAYKLRLDEAQHERRRWASLEHLGDLLADLVERIDAVALDLLGQQDVLAARQMLWQRLAFRLATLVRLDRFLFGRQLVERGLRHQHAHHRERKLLVGHKSLGLGA